MSVNEEMTFFKRLQVVGFLHAILALIFFMAEGFFNITLIEWWVKSDFSKLIVTIIFWVIAPKIVYILGLKV